MSIDIKSAKAAQYMSKKIPRGSKRKLKYQNAAGDAYRASRDSGVNEKKSRQAGIEAAFSLRNKIRERKRVSLLSGNSGNNRLG